MKELKVSKILPKHVGWEIKPDMTILLKWSKITAVGEFTGICIDFYNREISFSLKSDWIIRNPAEKEKKFSDKFWERWDKRVMGQCENVPLAVGALLDLLDEQFSKDHHE